MPTTRNIYNFVLLETALAILIAFKFASAPELQKINLLNCGKIFLIFLLNLSACSFGKAKLE